MAQRLSTPAIATIMQLPTIIRVGLIIALLGFIGLMFNQIKHDREVKHIQSIEIKSSEAKLIELDNKYKEVLELKSNTEAEKEEQQKRIEELEKQRKALEEQLQAKLNRQAEEKKKLAEAAKKATGTQSVSASPISGNKEDWLRQAGIPQSDWRFVDEIITRESNWNFKAVNKSSGAYGVCQSLPANKMASAGADYLTNPVTQLKWCHQYAQGYGSWAKAAEFSRCIGNCFSARANRVVYKDHKWW